jgi:glycine cleavage system H protein
MADVPPRQQAQPCVWVLAGVLSYRLCDRDFQCDQCELHHALQGRPFPAGALAGHETPVPEANQGVSGFLCRLLDGCTLHLDRPYTASHFWLAPSSNHEVLVGLNDYIVKALEPIDEIVSPGVGTWLTRDQPCGWMKRGHVAIPLRMPLSGEVTGFNQAYASKPAARGGDEEDWLFRLAPHEALDGLPGLFCGPRALGWHLDKLRLLGRYLTEAVGPEGAREVGATLADGGLPVHNLEAVIGPEPFQRLVDELFPMQI